MPFLQIPGDQMEIAAQKNVDIRFLFQKLKYLRVKMILVSVADKYQQRLVRQGRNCLFPPVEQQAEVIQFDKEPIMG